MNELHGGAVHAYPGCYDFSANLNPLGMPESVRKAVTENAALWEHYPDPSCTALREQLSRKERIPARQIVCGNGADDLLWRIVQALQPKRALLAVPTFSEYRRALESVGCCVETVQLTPENGFLLTDTFLSVLHPGLDMVILCHPNNPTGQLIPPPLLAEISQICRKYGIFLLCDECFLELTGLTGTHSAKQFLHERMMLLNAFTKTYAMPGLRLGYAIFGDETTAERVRQTGQYWSVSAPAQTAGLAALDQTDYLERSQALIAEERRFLTAEMRGLGTEVFPSAANFLLFRTKAGLFREMRGEHILLRVCGNFEGLDETYYRIAVRPHDENRLLLHALRRCLHG